VTQCEAVAEEASQEKKAMRLSELKCGLALALTGLGNVAAFHSDHHAAHSLFDESIGLSRSIGAQWELGYTLRLSGEIFLYEGDYAAARARLDESLKIFRETGDQWGLGLVLLWRGRAALPQADYELARAQLGQALAIFRELGDKWNIALSLNFLAEAARSQGDDARALQFYEETLAINRELGSKLGLHYSLHNLGYIALHRGDLQRAAELFKEALRLNLERQDPLGTAHCLAGLAGVAAVSGVSERATQLFGKAQAMLDEIGNVWASTDHLEVERYLTVAHAQLDAEKFTLAWEAGRTLTLEQAVEKALSVGTESQSDHFPALAEPLNERERETLRLIADGLSNHEIAGRLVISLSTVKWHINNLFGKLSVRSRTQALVRAKELGLL
jgi:non-specific serine/threonine protein kinase